jgi:PAS domain S-box-containing protein
MVDSLPALVWSALPDGRVQFVNKQWRGYAGLHTDEPISAEWQPAIHPDDQPQWLERWRSMATSDQPWELEHRLRRWDGEYRWFLCRASPITDATGKVVRWEAIYTDIDDRHRLEDDLRAAKTNFSSWAESFPGYMVTMSVSGDVELLSHDVLEYFGKTPEELRGWKMTDAVHPDDLPKVVAAFTESVSSGKPYSIEHRCRRWDGVYRWFHVRALPVRDQHSQITGWYVVLVDIDDAKRAEDAMRVSERRIRRLVEANIIGIFFWHADGRVFDANDELLRIIGHGREELASGSLRWTDFTLLESRERDLRVLEDLRTGGKGGPYERELLRKDGTRVPVLTDGSMFEGVPDEGVAFVVDLTGQKRAEEALRERERESHLILDTIPGLVAVLKPGGEIDAVNQELLAYCGQPLEAMQEWATNSILHPDDLAHMVPIFAEAIASGKPYDFEARIRRFDGVYRWLQVRGLPLRDSTGQIAHWYVLLADVDDRKRAEDAMRASERNLALTINTIPVLAWSAAADGRADFFNNHYLDYLGFSADEARGWGWTSAIHRDDLAALDATWQNILASGGSGEAEARMRRHDGAYRWFLFRASPLHDENGRVIRWYGVNIDIEDRKRAEDALRRSESFLLEIQRISHTGGWRYDVAAGIVESSPEIQRAYKPLPTEDITKPPFWFDRIHAEDRPRVEAEFERCLVERSEYQAGYRIVLPDGSIRYQYATGHPIVNDDGNLVEFIGASMDMTDHWRATSELNRASEALRELQMTMSRAVQVATVGELAASIAHEVNQPLSGIITNASTCVRMLDADPPNTEGARETARRTIRDGNRAADVITRLRALFNKREFTLEPLDLNDATREVIALYSSDLQRNSVVLESKLADDLPQVNGDRIQIQQVILNLLHNAADAMADVSDRQRELVISTEREGDGVCVAVRDAGVGINQQHIDRLFDPFYSTKSTGMGIGLSISRSIIERHHGRIWATPNEGPGATFSFTIPA